MGQMASGILYGCEAPALPSDESCEPLHDLVWRWQKAKKISWQTKGPKIRIIESEGGKVLLGVWVAVGGSGEDGASYFLEKCLPLDHVETVFAKSIARAAKLWERFAAYCAKKENLTLPVPALWLTPCETA